MNATAKFYTGFVLVLVVIVATSFALGYKFGAEHQNAVRAHASRR